MDNQKNVNREKKCVIVVRKGLCDSYVRSLQCQRYSCGFGLSQVFRTEEFTCCDLLTTF